MRYGSADKFDYGDRVSWVIGCVQQKK